MYQRGKPSVERLASALLAEAHTRLEPDRSRTDAAGQREHPGHQGHPCRTQRRREREDGATLQALLITAPEPLCAKLRCRSTIKLVETCAGPHPNMARLHEPTQALRLVLRSVAQRADALGLEARQLNRQLAALTERAATATSAVFALGPDTTSALLVSIGDNPDQLRSGARSPISAEWR